MPRAADPDLARRVAVEVVRTLRHAGHGAFFAGGCVRDALLGLAPIDFDVATDAPPQRVVALFERTQLVGAAFGVVLVTLGEQDIAHTTERPVARRPYHRYATVEVATFRSDGPYHDARRPSSVQFSDARADAQRRDFTINALFLDPLTPPDDPAHASVGGRIIDYVGGIADLDARRLRAVGDPDLRLAEDHLRALRAVRFASRFALTIDPATAGAIARHAAELRGVSRERIGEEMRRMLGGQRPDAALALLHTLGLDAPVLASGPLPDAPLRLVSALAEARRGEKSSPDPIALLAAWLLDRERSSGAGPWMGEAERTRAVVAARAALCLSNEETDTLRRVLTISHALADWNALGVAPRKRIAASSGFAGALELHAADAPPIAKSIGADVRELKRDGIGVSPEPFVTGDHLVAAGWTPGPLFRQVLDAVYDAQLEGRVRSHEQAMELAAELRV